MQKKHKNLWELLDLNPGAKKMAVDKAYLKKRKGIRGGEIRRAWKILRDPFYASTYSYYMNEKAIEEAGFFDDGLEPENDFPERFDPLFFTTPVHKIIKNLKSNSKGAKPVVLLSTGAFFPDN